MSKTFEQLIEEHTIILEDGTRIVDDLTGLQKEFIEEMSR